MVLSIIIPAYNEEKYLPAALAAVTKSAPDFLNEVIVVNNASADRTSAVARNVPRVRVVDEPNKGLTRARQRGLREARGELLAFVDADTTVSAQWFMTIQKEFAVDPRLVCLSGPYRYYDLSPVRGAIVWVYWNLLAYAAYLLTGYMTVGGNFVARRSALEKIGGFDTSIEFYGEDTNIARRLNAVGKVKFSRKFLVQTSARRFKQEGFVRTGLVYVVNFFSEVLFKKPLTKHYQDIR